MPGTWTGIEFDATAIIKAKGFFPDIKFRHIADTGELHNLPKYDGVICSEVIEHVEHDQRLVDNLVAITRRMLVITTPCYEVDDPGHLRLYTEKMLRQLFKAHGEIEILKTRRFFYVVWRRKK